MYTEDELLPISALQHYLFCPRQCALIHLEGAWTDNVLTMRGNILHQNAHSEKTEKRGNLTIARSLLLRSLRFGLVGQADVVELYKSPGRQGILQQVIPIEYKSGRVGAKTTADSVQLCSQALCLEEMLSIDIPMGALFYGSQKRRKEINFDEALRSFTKNTIVELHKLFEARETPPAIFAKYCQSCSIVEECMPQQSLRHKGVGKARKFLNALMEEI